MRDIAVIILNWNGEEDTIECLESLDSQSIYDIFLLDNGSRDKSIEAIRNYLEKSKYSYCEVINSIEVDNDINLYFVLSHDNKGFAKGNNFVVEQIKNTYEYILLLNNDTEVPADTIASMLNTLKAHELSAVTCDIRYYADKNALWNAGGKFTWYGDRKYFAQKIIDKKELLGENFIFAEFITGCALLVDSTYIRKYGLFTDKFFHGEEDYNFCLNLKKRGLKAGVDLSVRLYHKVGKSLKPEENINRYFNACTVHYSNRIIDYKEFMSKGQWIFWREFYLALIFLKRSLNGMNIKEAYKLVRKIHKITSTNNSIQKELFDEIMGY